MPVIGPIVSTLTGPTGLPTVLGAGLGIVLAPIGVAAIRKNLWDPGEKWAPALNIVAGGAMYSLAKLPFMPSFVKKMALGLLIGPIAVFAADMIRLHLLPAIGLGDFVTLPYMGYGDFMTLPYAGYGDQAAIEAGDLGGYGNQAMIEAGDLGTFGAYGEDPGSFYDSNRTF
jgi:hypothetical protein